MPYEGLGANGFTRQVHDAGFVPGAATFAPAASLEPRSIGPPLRRAGAALHTSASGWAAARRIKAVIARRRLRRRFFSEQMTR